MALQDPTLSLQDTMNMGKVIDLAKRNASVEYVISENDLPMGRSGYTVRNGTVRQICADIFGAFLGDDDDIRDAYVRVTTNGLEQFYPMSQITTMVQMGTMVEITTKRSR